MKPKITSSFISNCVIAFLGIFCFILAFQFVLPSVGNEKVRDLADGWTYQVRGMSEARPISLPSSKIVNPSGNVVSLVRALPDDYIPGAALMFSTVHQSLELFIDETKIYSYGVNASSPIGKSFGNAWHVIRLPNDYMSKQLTVRLQSPHSKYTSFADSVFFATKSALILNVIKSNFWSAFVGILLFVLGMSIKIGYYAIYRISKKSPVILYLSSFAAFAGLWVLSESAVLQFILNAPLAITTASMLSLLLMPLPLLYFFNSSYVFNGKKTFKVLILIHRIVAIATIILHLVHLVDFVYIIPIIHVLFAVDIITGICFCVTRMHKKVFRALLIGLSFLFVGMIVNAVLYFVSVDISVTLLSKWGMLIFIVIVGVDAGKHILTLSKTNVMNSALSQLAYNDTLTGLKNRASFQEHLDNLDKTPAALETVAIALADLNFLKKINDTYGHKKGDAIIVQCANFLSANFGKIGSVYRIGGDEFVVIIPTATPAQCNEAYSSFKRAIKLYNKTIPNGELLSVAVGIAHFSRAYDKNIHDLFNRADSAMYNNKIAMKERLAEKQNG